MPLKLYLSKYKSLDGNILPCHNVLWSRSLNFTPPSRFKHRFTGQTTSLMRIRDQYPAIVFRTRKLSVAFHRVYPSCITLDMTAAGGCLRRYFRVMHGMDGELSIPRRSMLLLKRRISFVQYIHGKYILSVMTESKLLLVWLCSSTG